MNTLENTMVQIIFPDKRLVSAKTIVGWAQDSLANGETSGELKTFADAVAMLEDSGQVTFHKSIDLVLDSPLAYELLP